MRPGHRRFFPVAVQKAREEIQELENKRKIEKAEQEEIRKSEKEILVRNGPKGYYVEIPSSKGLLNSPVSSY